MSYFAMLLILFSPDKPAPDAQAPRGWPYLE
jgi:hypothetical protein